MFTLKFYRQGRNGDYWWNVSTVEYAKDERDGFAFIIANGVEYQVGGEAPDSHPPYDTCWIENQSGKTIDRIGPFGQ